jgi:hypothetical protein
VLVINRVFLSWRGSSGHSKPYSKRGAPFL